MGQPPALYFYHERDTQTVEAPVRLLSNGFH